MFRNGSIWIEFLKIIMHQFQIFRFCNKVIFVSRRPGHTNKKYRGNLVGHNFRTSFVKTNLFSHYSEHTIVGSNSQRPQAKLQYLRAHYKIVSLKVKFP